MYQKKITSTNENEIDKVWEHINKRVWDQQTFIRQCFNEHIGGRRWYRAKKVIITYINVNKH